MRAPGIAIFLTTSLIVIAGAPLSGKGPSSSTHKGPHTSAAQAVTTLQAPSEQEVLAETAQVLPQLPGAAYVEDIPQYPPQQAADPYASPVATSAFSLRVGAGPMRPVRRALPRRRSGSVLSPMNVISGSLNVTGINPYWDYEEDAIGGVGRYMVNVATGNLIVQADDMAIPHRGIELAFRRTYNSFSAHDYANTDGSVVDNYGDGWTNTFDVHIAPNDLNNPNCPTRTGISVFDIDGARYDYSVIQDPSNGRCIYGAPKGQYAVLYFDAPNNWYYWTKKSGTVYRFHAPTDTTTGVAGRVSAIWGRNNNTRLVFTYSFDVGQPTDSAHLNKVAVQTETTAGQSMTATLNFSDVVLAPTGTNPSTHRLLISLVWPDGTTTIVYHYDTVGRLLQVDEPTNNTVNASIPQVYKYSGTTYLLTQAAGGRWILSNGAEGGYVQFTSVGNALANAKYYGVINPSISDSSGPPGPVQTSSYSGLLPGPPYRTATFAFPASSPPPAPAPSPTGSAVCSASGSTPWFDTDGHEMIFCWDASSRVVQIDSYTGSQWLVAKAGFDAGDNRISTVDVRGNETDYAFDGTGNVTAIGLPSVATSLGTLRPTWMFAHDVHNNTIAACDPTIDATNGALWISGPPSPSLCTTATAGAAVLAYTTSSYEPYGELTASTSPRGYSKTIAYALGPQGGTDYGLPTLTTGAQFNEYDANNQLTVSVVPSVSVMYDNLGNVLCTTDNDGTRAFRYDADNRQTASDDPDDVLRSGCPTPNPIPSGSTFVSKTSYYPNGQVSLSESPAQVALDGASPGPTPPGGVTYTYDADGNRSAVTHHHGGLRGTTTNNYDAAERLIEVQEPTDSTDVGYHLTRYLYDLTQHGAYGSLSIGGTASGFAYGGMFKFQRWVPVAVGTAASPGPATWNDIRGSTFDALDRARVTYAYAPNDAALHTASATYDADASTLGLLASSVNADGQTTQYAYDALAKVVSETYFDSGATPNESYAYDPSGRVTGITSSQFGTQNYFYDNDGNVITSQDPMSGGVTAPAKITYNYYPNDWRQNLSVAPESTSGINQSNLITYTYDGTGRRTQLIYTYQGTGRFAWSYTPAGRPSSQSDPLTGASIPGVNVTGSPYICSPPSNPNYCTFQPLTMSYDGYGRLSNETIPETANYTGFAYDPEGELTGSQGYEIIGNSNYPYIPETVTYNIRGEVTTQSYSQNNKSGWPQFYHHAVYGYMANNPGAGYPTTSQATDFREAVEVGYTVNCGYGCGSKTYTYVFDPTGRQTSETGGATATRTYDTLGRTLSSATSSDSGNTSGSYSWGPNGHPILMSALLNGTPSTETIHWDGDTPLYTSATINGADTVDDIKIGPLADILTASGRGYLGLTVWDRDWGGWIVSNHNSTGFGSWAPQDAYLSPGQFGHSPPPQTSGYSPGAPPISEPRTDELFGGGDHIHGVRGYDPTLQSWTSKDADPGSAFSPATLNQYEYDGNNPVTFNDPSGFYELTVDPGIDSGNWTDDAARMAALYAGAAIASFMAPPTAISMAAGGDISNYSTGMGGFYNDMVRDLTPGQGNWQVHLTKAPNGTSSLAGGSTSYHWVANKTGFGGIVSDPLPSQFYMDWFNSKSRTEGERQAAIATELAIYEIVSGNFGSSLRAEYGAAKRIDIDALKKDDWNADQLTNMFLLPQMTPDQ